MSWDYTENVLVQGAAEISCIMNSAGMSCTHTTQKNLARMAHSAEPAIMKFCSRAISVPHYKSSIRGSHQCSLTKPKSA